MIPVALWEGMVMMVDGCLSVTNPEDDKSKIRKPGRSGVCLHQSSLGTSSLPSRNFHHPHLLQPIPLNPRALVVIISSPRNGLQSCLVNLLLFLFEAELGPCSSSLIQTRHTTFNIPPIHSTDFQSPAFRTEKSSRTVHPISMKALV